jgi:type VI secretion system protein ImpC
MPGNISFGRVELTTEARPSPAREVIGEVTPFRIGILGNVRGHRGAAVQGTLGEPVPIDRDNIEAVMRRLDVGLRLSLPGQDGPPIVLAFRSMDDFEPDRLIKAEVFQALCDARRQLADPSTFQATAAGLGLLRAEEPPPAPPPAVPQEGSADLLAQILGQTAAEAPKRPVEDRSWRDFLGRITAPHVVSKDPRQDEVVAGVEAAMAELVRVILHHPEFQALEALWRGVDTLVRQLETDETLTIELIDTTRSLLEDDLVSAVPLEKTATYKRIVEPSVGTEGGMPWAILAGDLTFAPAPRDVVLLWRLGQVARFAGAPFVAAASARFVGVESLASTPDPDDWGTAPEVEGWADLRRGDEAPYIGLALPRMLMRLPYGADTVPVDAFRFEEHDAPAHEVYLWGNPALAVARLVAEAFTRSGWNWSHGFDPEIGDLPLHVRREDGEHVTKPCAEALMTHRAVDRLLDAGLMPMVWVRDTDRVRLAQLRSIADPPTALAVRHD